MRHNGLEGHKAPHMGSKNAALSCVSSQSWVRVCGGRGIWGDVGESRRQPPFRPLLLLFLLILIIIVVIIMKILIILITIQLIITITITITLILITLTTRLMSLLIII